MMKLNSINRFIEMRELNTKWNFIRNLIKTILKTKNKIS